MSGFLHQLENNEAILLMYIAGELPEEDRREVEQMLTVDAGLRKMHEELRASVTSAMTMIERLDADEPPGLPREVAARRVGRMVRQWHAARVAAPRLAPAPPAPRKIPWYLTVSAAAALLGIGLIAWWGFSPEVPASPAREYAGGSVEVFPPVAQPEDGPAPGSGAEAKSVASGTTAGPVGTLTTDADFASGQDLGAGEGSGLLGRDLTGGLAGVGGVGKAGNAEENEVSAVTLSELERQVGHLSELSSAH